MTASPITDALALELDGHRSRLDAAMDLLSDVELEQTTVSQKSEEAADTIRRFGDAAEFCEMPGLKSLASFFERNLRTLGTLAADDRIEIVNSSLLRDFGPRLSRFLRAPSDSSTLEGILEQASDERWPTPLGLEEGDRIKTAILSECADRDGESSSNVEHRIGGGDVQPEDVALTFAPDINPQLAETFLVEAPQHTAKFTNAIQRLAGHDPSPEHVTHARRLAHTIKGSANITGVKGLANITHYVEDILERLAERTETPPVPLRDLLLETADCLEIMVENLAAGGESPGQAADILRGLVEWQSRLTSGEGETDTPADSPPAESSATTETASPPASTTCRSRAFASSTCPRIGIIEPA